MKITKSQLRQIIKEELQAVMEMEEREWPGEGVANWMPGAAKTRETGGWQFPSTMAGTRAFEWHKKHKEKLLKEIGVPISQIGGGAPVADPHTAAIDSLKDYIANHYPGDDALRELVENVQADVAEFEDDMQDKLAGEGSSGLAPREI